MLHIIGFIIVGCAAGWLAGKVMSGHGYGVVGDIVLGAVGGLVVGWIFGAASGTIGGANFLGWLVEFVVALLGACALVGIVHLIRREPVRTG
jgi:uncharacterized membrane protein YeaQ/YmgE (transglycosylase-associated protein family)